MKKYVSYLDSISVAPEQHERTMKRLNQEPRLAKKPRVLYRYAGLAACAAVLLLCIWTIPGLFNNPNIPNNPIVPHTSSSDNPTVNNPAQATPSNSGLSTESPNSTIKIAVNEIEKPEPFVMGMFALMGEDFVEMTYDEITAYFGVTIPITDVFPVLRCQPKPEDYLYGIYKSEQKYPVWNGNGYTSSDEARGVYFDANSFLFASADGTQSLCISIDKVFHYPTYNFIEALSNVEEVTFTQINNRELTIFHFIDSENDCYYVEFVQNGVAYCISASNLSQVDFAKCLTVLITEAELVANPRAIIGTISAIDSYACHIGLKTDDGLSYGIYLPQGETEKYSLYQKVKIVYNGEPATVGEIWRQQLVSISIID